MNRVIMILVFLCSLMPLHAAEGDRPEEIIKSIIKEEPDRNKQVQKKEPEKKDKEDGVVKDGPAEDAGKKIPREKRARKGETPPAIPTDEILFKTGIQLFQADLPEAAQKKFIELRTKYPQSPHRDNAVIWIGKIYLRANRPDEAIKEFSSIGEESGEYPLSLFHTGDAYTRKNQAITAVESYYRVASLFPGHELADDALIRVTKIYIAEKKGTQALEAVTKLIKHYPDRETVDEAYYLMGKIYEKDPMLKDPEMARKIYRLFLKKAEEEDVFRKSPLKAKVERDLKYIESTYFKMEN